MLDEVAGLHLRHRLSPLFCRAHRTVLDCANGYQKEEQEEVDESEEKRNQEGASTAARTEAKNFKTIVEEGSRSEESHSKEKSVGENTW